jgi:uncharacterized Zn-binding protein involved in type VI secretion
VSAAGRLGDKSHTPADAHACPSCPHSAEGPATTGSDDVFLNDRPALRVADTGVHDYCCGRNHWTAIAGAPAVFINDRPAHRSGDASQHCGGKGELIEGSDDVFIGDAIESESGNDQDGWAMTSPEPTPLG